MAPKSNKHVYPLITKTINLNLKETELKLAERVAYLTLINDIGSKIAAVLDLDTVLNQAARLVQTTFGHHHVALFFIDKNILRLKAVAGSYQRYFPPGHTQQLTVGINGWVATHGQKILANDVNQEARYISLIADHSITQAELCLPLKIGEETLGVLDIQNPQLNAFSQDDVTAMETITNQIAIAIENARLHQETEQRAKELSLLNEAGQAMTASLNLDTVLAQVLTKAQLMLGVEGASVILPNTMHKQLVFAAVVGPGADILIGKQMPLNMGIAGWVMHTKQPILVEDIQQDSRFYPHIDVLTGVTTRSLITVPLIYQNNVIGVIEALNKTNSTFNQQDLALLQAISNSAAIAIENARLHTETEKRATQLAVLHELDQAITASLNIQDVYEAITKQVARLLTYDRLSISLIDDDKTARLVYTYGGEDALPQINMPIPIETSVTGWVVKQGEPLLLNNVKNQHTFDHNVELTAKNIESSMVIPLKIKGKVIGTWNIGSHKPNLYTQEDFQIAQSMTQQLAIAIENARLYEKEKEQLHHLRDSHNHLIQVEKMAALGRLVASLAHEINNPLQSVQGFLELIAEDLIEENYHAKLTQYLDIAKTEIDRVATIVRGMRDFYRATPYELSVEVGNTNSPDNFFHLSSKSFTRCDLHAILKSVLQLANKQLSQHNINVTCNWEKDLPLLEVNADLLKQVFLNLILNAVDSMQQTGGTLYIKTDLVATPVTFPTHLHYKKPDFVVSLKVQDTGVGIPPEIQSRLFEPFFTTKEQGSGLGLATSYRIIEAHHGQITLKSRVDKGTVFVILLPVSQPASN